MSPFSARVRLQSREAGSCIRVLLHVNTEKTQEQIRHVYLREAAILRPAFAYELERTAVTGIALEGRQNDRCHADQRNGGRCVAPYPCST